MRPHLGGVAVEPVVGVVSVEVARAQARAQARVQARARMTVLVSVLVVALPAAVAPVADTSSPYIRWLVLVSTLAVAR